MMKSVGDNMELEDNMASLQIKDSRNQITDHQIEQNNNPSQTSDSDSIITLNRNDCQGKRRVQRKPMKFSKELMCIQTFRESYLERRIKKFKQTFVTLPKIAEEDEDDTDIPVRETERLGPSRRTLMKPNRVSAPQRVFNKHKFPLHFLLEQLDLL